MHKLSCLTLTMVLHLDKLVYFIGATESLVEDGLKRLSLYITFLCSLSSAQADNLQIITPKQTYDFQVEVAQNEAQLKKGLMHRFHLGEREGMLFLFPKNSTPRIWMKNTLIPLDVIFIDETGLIKDIYPNAQPLSLEIIQSNSKATSVLEIKGGMSGRLGIFPGQQVILPTSINDNAEIAGRNHSK